MFVLVVHFVMLIHCPPAHRAAVAILSAVCHVLHHACEMELVPAVQAHEVACGVGDFKADRAAIWFFFLLLVLLLLLLLLLVSSVWLEFNFRKVSMVFNCVSVVVVVAFDLHHFNVSSDFFNVAIVVLVVVDLHNFHCDWRQHFFGCVVVKHA